MGSGNDNLLMFKSICPENGLVPSLQAIFSIEKPAFNRNSVRGQKGGSDRIGRWATPLGKTVPLQGHFRGPKCPSRHSKPPWFGTVSNEIE
jgi:hypothetical protein